MTAPADKGKKAKTDADAADDNEQIDGALVMSIERLQEIQDELEKVTPLYSAPRSSLVRPQRFAGGWTAGLGSGLGGLERVAGSNLRAI
jgi:hypothetical protein